MVGMSLENECLTGFCWSNAEIDACGSTGNLLIWRTLGGSFFLNEEKPLPPRQKNVTTVKVMTFV
jgi:hypothetical protein